MNIQERINRLKPYVSEIKIDKETGIPIVLVELSKNWGLIKSATILDFYSANKEIERPNKTSFAFYAADSKIGLDEIFDYIEKVIKANKDNEEKYKLLDIKVTELQQLFKTTPLKKLKNLRFTLDEPLMTNVTESVTDTVFISDEDSSVAPEPQKQEAAPENPKTQENAPKNPQVHPENPKPQENIPQNTNQRLVPEPTHKDDIPNKIDWNKIKDNTEPVVKKRNPNIELPPKDNAGKIKLETFEVKVPDKCNHPSDQFCDLCMPG